MALEEEEADTKETSDPGRQRKTVSTALALLQSLSPHISQILKGGTGVKVPLEVLDVLKTKEMTIPANKGQEKGISSVRKDIGTKEQEQLCKIGAGVLFVGPREPVQSSPVEETRKLMDVCGRCLN